MMSKRTVLYMTDPNNLAPINASVIGGHVTHILIGLFHLGYDNKQQKNTPYVHLGNQTPDHFPQLWSQVTVWQNRGVKVMGSLGGWAVGDYRHLFSDYTTFYALLKNTLEKYNLDGLDLDIEDSRRYANTKNIQQLIGDLRTDFCQRTDGFLLSSAPVASALTGGGSASPYIDYKTLLSDFDFYNLQFYGWGNLNGPGKANSPNYDTVINAVGGKYAAKMVAGTLTNPANGNGYLPIAQVVSVTKQLTKRYSAFGGIMGWNSANALNVHEKVDPAGWCQAISEAQQ